LSIIIQARKQTQAMSKIEATIGVAEETVVATAFVEVAVALSLIFVIITPEGPVIFVKIPMM
jgi:hypothetical protein